jgi:hypothetical protein
MGTFKEAIGAGILALSALCSSTAGAHVSDRHKAGHDEATDRR